MSSAQCPPRSAAVNSTSKRRLQRAMDDQAGIAFDLGDVVAVIMNAVAVEGQRGIAEQQHRIGEMACGDVVQALPLPAPVMRRKTVRRLLAIDDVLPLADGDAAGAL